MSAKKRRHKRRPGLLGAAGVRLGAIAAHPARFTSLTLFSLLLCWLILTKSLPYALAPAAPDMALRLNPNNPVALIAIAERTRAQLLSLAGGNVSQAAPAAPAQEETPGATIADLPQAPGAPGEADGLQDEREELRGEIRQLATKAIAADPMNASAFRLLAEVTAGPEQIRDLMQQAVQRSRRESTAVFWLLDDSYRSGDIPAVAGYADILLRTKPEIAESVMNYVANITRDPAGRILVVDKVANVPEWRRPFFENLPGMLERSEAVLDVVTGLKASGRPAKGNELQPILKYLIGINRADVAYNVWLQSLPDSRLESLGLMSDPGFENGPSVLPFEWYAGTGINASLEFVPSSQPGGKRLLHISFNGGRVQFPEFVQVLLLGPGRYRLEGQVRGSIEGQRGLRWQIRCLRGKTLGETDMLTGKSQQWRTFSLEAEVPKSQECIGQLVRLVHDSRSASEEFLTGEVWFGDLKLERLADRKAAHK
ncbi:MAG: hypothetical protein ACLPWS_03595 [Rhodomicrobium sp.]